MLKEVHNFQYLFLGGILGEILSLPFVGNYLRVNKKIFMENGVEGKDIHYTTLSSFKSACDNANTLRDLIQRLYLQNDKKIILMAHSKACLETFLCLTQHFEEIKPFIHKVICVSPPFRGSTLFEKRNNHWYDGISYNVIHAAKKVMPGARCLNREYYTEQLEQDINSNEEIKSFVKDNVLVVKSYKETTKKVAWVIKPSHQAMQLHGKDNDGLLTLCDQELPNVTYDEVTLKIDHSDLFTSRLLSNNCNNFRTVFMSRILAWAIYQNRVIDTDIHRFEKGVTYQFGTHIAVNEYLA
jgi:thioredoxin-related protein